jgi:hypothetical protein
MTKPKPLGWYATDHGPTPDCDTCMDELLSPGFAEAVHSVAIEHPQSPQQLARQAINAYHNKRHRDVAP